MALAFIFLAAPLSAQPPLPPDLVTEFASAVASRVAPGETASVEPLEQGFDDVQARIASSLAAHGVRTGRDGSATSIRFTCFQNLRERGCAADLEKAGVHEPVVVSRPLERAPASAPALSLDVQPLFGQRAPILDAVVDADRLFVLSPETLALYRRRANSWDPVASQPIVSTHAWPRDVRGRLRVAADGSVVALLPGLACRSMRDLASLTCDSDREPWPLDMPNAGLDGQRNHFTTPEGVPFFNVAALATGAGAAWLTAAPSGELVFFDGERRAVGAAASGDDVVALDAPCVGESLVLVASSAGEGDTIRAFRVSDRRLVPRAAPVEWRGQVTALWTEADRRTATAIVRSEGGRRYDAYQIHCVCDR